MSHHRAAAQRDQLRALAGELAVLPRPLVGGQRVAEALREEGGERGQVLGAGGTELGHAAIRKRGFSRQASAARPRAPAALSQQAGAPAGRTVAQIEHALPRPQPHAEEGAAGGLDRQRFAAGVRAPSRRRGLGHHEQRAPRRAPGDPPPPGLPQRRLRPPARRRSRRRSSQRTSGSAPGRSQTRASAPRVGQPPAGARPPPPPGRPAPSAGPGGRARGPPSARSAGVDRVGRREGAGRPPRSGRASPGRRRAGRRARRPAPRSGAAPRRCRATRPSRPRRKRTAPVSG